MSEKRFRIVHLNLKRLDRCDIQDTAQEIPTFYNDLGYRESVEPVCDLLNELNDENVFLTKQRDYWKAKFVAGVETFTTKDTCETYKIPNRCDECDFLGNNGVCGYCKFTLECYDGKDDLIDGKVLENCPFNKNKEILKILHCIATQTRGHTDEQLQFLRKLERQMFPEEE